MRAEADQAQAAEAFGLLGLLDRGEAGRPPPYHGLAGAVWQVLQARRAADSSSPETALAALALLDDRDLSIPAVVREAAALYDRLGRPQPDGLRRAAAEVAAWERNRNPHLFQRARLKARLLSFLPEPEAAAVYATWLGHERPPRCRRLPIVGLEAFLTETGGKIPLLRRKRFDIRDPMVHGATERRAWQVEGREIFAGTVRDAVVAHRSSFIEAADRLLLDVQRDELGAIDLIFGFDPIVLAAGQGFATCVRPPQPATVELAEAIHLGGATSYAFGHWIGEYLLKLVGAVRAGVLPAAPILIDAGMPPQHRRALELLGGSTLSLVEIPVGGEAHVGRLWVMSSWQYVPLCPAPRQNLSPLHLAAPPVECADHMRWLAARADMPPRPAGRLFLSRKPHQHRKLVNLARIEAIAQEIGYRIVHMEDLPFEEQVALVRSAEAIAGPEGSAMTLALFAREGTRVTILDHPFVENLGCLTTVLEALGLDCLMVAGRPVRIDQDYPRFSDYEIDEDSFRRAVRREQRRPA